MLFHVLRSIKQVSVDEKERDGEFVEWARGRIAIREPKVRVVLQRRETRQARTPHSLAEKRHFSASSPLDEN